MIVVTSVEVVATSSFMAALAVVAAVAFSSTFSAFFPIYVLALGSNFMRASTRESALVLHPLRVTTNTTTNTKIRILFEVFIFVPFSIRNAIL